jgi:hypothetical protein
MRNCLAPFNALALSTAAVLLFVVSAAGQQPAQSQEIAADLPTAAAIKAWAAATKRLNREIVRSMNVAMRARNSSGVSASPKR